MHACPCPIRRMVVAVIKIFAENILIMFTLFITWQLNTKPDADPAEKKSF